jgi:protocatechuate 3,4-dioxygenase beta subunit
MMIPVVRGGLIVLLACLPLPHALAADSCPPTPRQTAGPYYPPKAQIEAQPDKDFDLTQIKGQAGRAKGQVLHLTGRIRDTRCRPIEGAVVEIWQASENGRYRHPDESDSPKPLDPHFQYWGKHTTGNDGGYLFKTIKPAPYSIGSGRTRPSHIHCKVSHPEFGEFITQMYFAGDAYQDKDRIFNAIPASERDRVVVTMEPPGADHPLVERDARICRFDVTISRP